MNSESVIKILKTGMFPIENITYGKSLVRVHHVTDNLESIKNSLKKFGQLTAIIIYEENEKYELLTGQRRLNAAIELGWTEIRADLIEKPKELLSKAISFTENEIHEKVSQIDVIDACNEFYYKYGNIKTVSEKLALPDSLVRNAVKLPRCPPEIKKAVESGEIKLETAIKATDALKWDQGKSNEGVKVLELAKLLEDNMPRNLQKALIEVGRSDPTRSLKDMVEEAKNHKIVEIKIILDQKETSRLNKFAEDEDVGEAAVSLILDGLEEHGY